MRRTVLYFDDDQRLLDLFREMFSGRYEVLIAATLDEARRALNDCAPEIIISDQLMPEIQGTEFLREAAKACPDSFRILLTGQATLGELFGEISSGLIQLFEAKPWREARINEILERASAVLDQRLRRRD
ncbi:MAG TPA: response regulator [Pyrinomonadaceae bacterium]